MITKIASEKFKFSKTRYQRKKKPKNNLQLVMANTYDKYYIAETI